MSKIFTFIAVVALVFAVSVSAGAYVFDGQDIDIEYWTGTGTSEALVLIDFGANSYAFGYRWDGSEVTGLQMMNDIDAAGTLELVVSDYGWGAFIDGITYGSDSHIGYNGDSNWWHYWNSLDGVNWYPSDVGAGSRIIANGMWDGWGYGFDTAPDMPNAVPEPGTMAALGSLIGLASATKLLRFRK